MRPAAAEIGIDLSVVADFRGAAAGGSLLGMGVGADGTVVAILGDRVHAAYAAGRPARGARADAALFLSPVGEMRRLNLEPIELRYVRPQPLAGGGVLVVEARTGDDTPNATVFGPDGRVSARFDVGDGIEEAMVDAAGELWVGYFDERVYSGGAYSGESSDEYSGCGLNRFDLAGRRTWAYSSDRVGPIYHCYALNVAADEAWAVIYSDAFELIRVGRRGEIDGWGRLGTVGWTRGVLVDGDDVLIVGAHEGRSSCALWRLGDTPELLATFRLAAPRGFPPPEHAETYGRGDVLYLPEDGVCYKLTLRR